MTTVDIDKLLLQPLRIPEGWTVEYNQFFEVEPGAAFRLEGSATDDIWQLFSEDMLLLVHSRHEYQLELGWYPDSDPSGRFCVALIHKDNWENPSMQFEGREKEDVVSQIEVMLRDAAIAR